MKYNDFIALIESLPPYVLGELYKAYFAFSDLFTFENSNPIDLSYVLQKTLSESISLTGEKCEYTDYSQKSKRAKKINEEADNFKKLFKRNTPQRSFFDQIKKLLKTAQSKKQSTKTSSILNDLQEFPELKSRFSTANYFQLDTDALNVRVSLAFAEAVLNEDFDGCTKLYFSLYEALAETLESEAVFSFSLDEVEREAKRELQEKFAGKSFDSHRSTNFHQDLIVRMQQDGRGLTIHDTSILEFFPVRREGEARPGDEQVKSMAEYIEGSEVLGRDAASWLAMENILDVYDPFSKILIEKIMSLEEVGRTGLVASIQRESISRDISRMCDESLLVVTRFSLDLCNMLDPEKSGPPIVFESHCRLKDVDGKAMLMDLSLITVPQPSSLVRQTSGHSEMSASSSSDAVFTGSPPHSTKKTPPSLRKGSPISDGVEEYPDSWNSWLLGNAERPYLSDVTTAETETCSA